MPPQRGMRKELVVERGDEGPALITNGLSLGLGIYVKKLSDGSEETVEAIAQYQDDGGTC